MTRIGIIEDNVDDLVKRYVGVLKLPYEVHLILTGDFDTYIGGSFEYYKRIKDGIIDPELKHFWNRISGTSLSEDDISNIQERFKNKSNYDLDLPRIKLYGIEHPLDIPETLEREGILRGNIYFVDGLCGKCFYLADKLGKDKVFITSTDRFIEMRAENEGYRTANPILCDTLIEAVRSKLE